MKTIYEFEIEIIGNGFQKTIGPLIRDETQFEALEKTIESFHDPECINQLELTVPRIHKGTSVFIPSKIFRTSIVTITQLGITTEP